MKRIKATLALFGLLLAACTSASTPTPTDAPIETNTPVKTPMPPTAKAISPESDLDPRQMLYDLIDPDSDIAQLAYGRVLGEKDTRFIAAFLELMRMNSLGVTYHVDFVESVGALEALSGESFGGDWAGCFQRP